MKSALVFGAMAIAAASHATLINFEDLYKPANADGSGAVIAANYHAADGISSWSGFKSVQYSGAPNPLFFMGDTTDGKVGAYTTGSASITFTSPVKLGTVELDRTVGAPAVTLLLASGSTATVTGLQTSKPFTIDLSSYGAVSAINVDSSRLLMDNLNFTVIPAVPEPMSMFALAGGVALLLRRRKQA